MIIPCRFLFKFSELVNINIDYFYESYSKKNDFNFEKDIDNQTLKFLQHFIKIDNSETREKFSKLMKNQILNHECYM